MTYQPNNADTMRIYPYGDDWTPLTLSMSAERCLVELRRPEVDVRDVVHTWCLHWGFTGRDYDDIMRPYITGDWREYDGLSSPLWRGKAKRTGRELFEDCEISEHLLAYHPVAIAHDDDFRHQRGFWGSNRRFARRSAQCEFGQAKAVVMYAFVSTVGLPIYLIRGREARRRRKGR